MFKFVYARKSYLNAATAMLLALQTLSPVWASSASTHPAEADKIHIVLLLEYFRQGGGDMDPDRKDVAAMKKTVETAFADDMGRVVMHDLTGINSATGFPWTALEVRAYLLAMNVGANDNVLVYHSGHGRIYDSADPEGTQVLGLNGGSIGRKTVMDAACTHNPRALIILSDCCSTYGGGPVSFEVPEAANLNVDTVRMLLLTPVGIISLTAAEDGTPARSTYEGTNPGQAGSAFTVAFLRLCYREDVTFLSWEGIFPVLRMETYQTSGGSHYARAFQISQ